MNRSGWLSHWQEETPVVVSLVLSLAMLMVTLVTLWIWPGGAHLTLPG